MQRDKPELDPESDARMKEVRNELWWGGLQGLVIGTGVGAGGHYALTKFVPSLNKKLNRNTLLASVLLAGSIGSFLGAITFGKNAIQHVGDIIRTNSNPTSTYRRHMVENEKNLVNSFNDAYSNREEAIRKAVESRDPNKKL